MLTKARKSRVTEIDILVSKNLKAKRLELGITRQTLSEFVGVSATQIQKYEKGLDRISSGKLFAFANYLKVPISYFFEQNNKRRSS